MLHLRSSQYRNAWHSWCRLESKIDAVHFYSDVDDTAASVAQFNALIDLLKTTGKQIWVSVNVNRDQPGFDPETPSALRVDPFLVDTDTLPSATTAAINAINNRLADITKASVEFNAYLGSGGYNRWILGESYPAILQDPITKSINPTLAEMQRAASLMPTVLAAGKLAFTGMIEVPFEREAYIHQADLSQAGMLNWIKANNVAVNIGRGAWVLDKDIVEHYTWYMVSRDARSPLLVHKNKYPAGSFPYQYYRDYLAQADFYSGMGYHRGLKRNNADGLITAGYKGSWFLFNTETKTEFESYRDRKEATRPPIVRAKV